MFFVLRMYFFFAYFVFHGLFCFSNLISKHNGVGVGGWGWGWVKSYQLTPNLIIHSHLDDLNYFVYRTNDTKSIINCGRILIITNGKKAKKYKTSEI